MPHDVTMPQLGMAQDAGKLVTWIKAEGDAVKKGDALFEVETDKATMEVEAQADGFLTHLSASEGDDVPVGAVIARISDSADAPAPAAASAPPETDDTADALPDGKPVTMPQLGMAQDTGMLVGWHKSPGDAVAVGDILFEVETDKATMDVEADKAGYLAATLAAAGDDVPVGQTVAIISDEKPATPIARSVADAAAASAPKSAKADDTPAQPTSDPKPPKPAPAPERATSQAGQSGGRILASPKMRRLAIEQGLDLQRLVDAGHPQPFHCNDLDALKALPDPASQTAATTGATAALRLVAEVAGEALADFTAWASGNGSADATAILAGLAAASLPAPGPVAVSYFGRTTTYVLPADRRLAGTAPTEDTPALTLRDLRGSPLSFVALGAEDTPVLTLTGQGDTMTLTLECSPAHLDPQDAIQFLTDFAGRVQQPLRHLL
ncbi:biotin/lipoyl-containing protein [Loktanella sp. SALINAS62]|uniref:biotin/lipoyl-containing protein n=1 Tax=Loktanella sp. SALINAS62 TaxID=2706124 RepID=UPI001B8AABA4|nr:biotin/lipoyl-containing protein [Loktanella sp. SALINAS62]MBS1302055.1 pyruvate dehydrogenase [Loktanella sp. SALINAS62]